MTRSEKNFDSTAQRRVRTYRRWSVMQKREIVAQTYQAGESVLTVARRILSRTTLGQRAGLSASMGIVRIGISANFCSIWALRPRQRV